MSKYTDAKGVEYDVHPELNVGEVAFLMEEEKAAWKVDQHILMAARYVLFHTCSPMLVWC